MRVEDALAESLYRRAGAERWRLSPARWREALETSAARAGTDAAAVARYLRDLHLEDLALACACAEGQDAAWDHFVATYRPVLYRAADAIDPSGGARELADALYGELFGLGEGGDRRSLFRYFHGRSSLATWLRAVLSQRHVDRLRTRRRLDPLPEDDSPAFPATAPAPASPERLRFLAAIRATITAVIAALAPRDRLRLSCYYADNLTLAEIGRLLGEHEATASRHLAKTRAAIRRDVERLLRDEHGFDEAAMANGFAAVLDDAGSLDLAEILGSGTGKNRVPDRSTT